jgi:hypothetical protein
LRGLAALQNSGKRSGKPPGWPSHSILSAEIHHSITLHHSITVFARSKTDGGMVIATPT